MDWLIQRLASRSLVAFQVIISVFYNTLPRMSYVIYADQPSEMSKDTHIDLYNQLINDSKPVQYTDENPRRSNRLKGKPLKYYGSNEDDDEDEYDDDDEEYVDESYSESDDEITRTIKRLCNKNNWPYSADLVTDYKAWYLTASVYVKFRYDYNTRAYDKPSKTETIIKAWAKEYSAKLKPHYRMTALKNGLISYCKRHGYEHNEKLVKKFTEWASDPANTTHVHTYANVTSGVYEYSPAKVVTDWFKTLKKVVVF